ncbi:MAG: virulence protein RhuM/Fic/DOC family protein [Bacteroidales bacterium]|nr:virulence protein RhuM/Fic/DOC family protein [Candidatus Sodaliphilus fimicaballi]
MNLLNNIEETFPIALYISEDGSTKLNVQLQEDTVWLSVKQMSSLFAKEESNIRRHVNNVFKEGELERESNVHFLHVPISDKPVPFYSLDVIISIGYRVKSKQGVHFRKWATSTLKQYLLKGYIVDQNRLDHYNELKDVIRLMARTYKLQEELSSDEAEGMVSVIGDYVYALDTLDHYDYQDLTIDKTTREEPFHATYENAMASINRLKKRFGGSALFANEKDDSFKSSIGQIYQTFGGEDLYPSVEEKAAMLLYLVVKNHSFSDGNKRIAAMLFLWFMENNKVLYSADGHKRIADNTLVAITLMIAESRPEEKEIIVKVVVNLINQNNQ